ncbi:hypothetical protein AUJ17_00010 [Candidatus Micrarchaeota archaeon CG1_02_47_40]|nr:MAG: hypothetical protein AUJ17_00010 [Candidatus Micrarchaeota archaeon CG1_02_47_40]
MEINVIKQEKNFVEIELVGEDISFANAIREIVLEDADVEFASCTLSHPQIGHPKLIVRTKKKDALKVLSAAAKKLGEMAGKFKKEVEE